MKILVVSSYLPFPLFSGGHVRLYNLLKGLSIAHEITLVCEKRSHQTSQDIAAVKKFCKEIYVVERKKQWSAGVVFQTAISSLPFLLAGHSLPAIKKILTKLIKDNKYDVIHVETFYVYQNLPETLVPTVLVEHNIEYKVYQRFEKTVPIFVRPLLHIDVEKIKYWEKLYWKKATKVVGVSKIEAAQMRSDAIVVPNGVDLKNFKFYHKGTTLFEGSQMSNVKFQRKEKTVLFMGDFKWIQNKNTAQWILKDIWPEIQLRTQNSKLRTRLWIVGKHIPDNLKQYSSDSIIIDEHAPDRTSEIFNKTDILLSPIKVGGGTSYKILESMASGVPVVTNLRGIEGLEAENQKHALIGETSEELAKQVITLLEDEKTYQNIAENARKLIEENYTWEKITKKLEGVYRDAIKK